MRILNKIENNICAYICCCITVTDFNKGKCIKTTLLRNNRIVSYKALVFEMELMKVILHLKEIMKTKSFEVGSMLNSYKWVKELRIISEHLKSAGWIGSKKKKAVWQKICLSVSYTCWPTYQLSLFLSLDHYHVIIGFVFDTARKIWWWEETSCKK